MSSWSSSSSLSLTTRAMPSKSKRRDSQVTQDSQTNENDSNLNKIGLIPPKLSGSSPKMSNLSVSILRLYLD